MLWLLQELPEMLVPYATYLLAHHPDFPGEIMAGSDHEVLASYEPFQRMLQQLLQPLLMPGAGVTAGSGNDAGAMLPAILKMFKYMKHTEDALVGT